MFASGRFVRSFSFGLALLMALLFSSTIVCMPSAYANDSAVTLTTATTSIGANTANANSGVARAAGLVTQANLTASGITAQRGGHQYKLFNKGMSWSKAKKYCESIGGHLATITTKAEQNAVQKMVKKGSRNSYWLGGYMNSSGSWKWVTGERFSYAYWADNQPDNANPDGEDKLMMYRSSNPNSPSSLGEWNDLKADGTFEDESFFGLSNLGFICEWEYSIELSDSLLVLDKGDKTYVTCSVVDSNGNKVASNITWSSNRKSVAKVSSKGKVVAVNPGSCTITCKANNGLKKSVRVVVKPQKVKSVKALSKSRNFVQLKWVKQSGVSKYQVYVYDADLEEYTLAKTVKGTSNTARIKNLSKNTKYKFKVRGVVKAWSRNYNGSFSRVRSVRTSR